MRHFILCLSLIFIALTALPAPSWASIQEQDLILSGDIDSLVSGVVKGLQIQKNIIDSLRGDGILVGLFFIWLVFVAFIWIKRVSDNGAEIYNFISWLAVVSIVLFIMFSTIRLKLVYYDFEKELRTQSLKSEYSQEEQNSQGEQKSQVEPRGQLEVSAINSFVTLASEIAHVLTKAVLGPFVGSNPQAAIKAMDCKHTENIPAKAFVKMLDEIKADSNNIRSFWYFFKTLAKDMTEGKVGSCYEYSCYEASDVDLGNQMSSENCYKRYYCERFKNFVESEVNDCINVFQQTGASQEDIKALESIKRNILNPKSNSPTVQNFYQAIKQFQGYENIILMKAYDPALNVVGDSSLNIARQITAWIGEMWLKIQPTMVLHLRISFVVQAILLAINIVVTPFVIILFLTPTSPGIGINFRGFLKLITSYLLLFLWYPLLMFVKFVAYGKLI